MAPTNIHRTDMDDKEDRVPATPRLRMSLNRSSPFTITDSWQSIPFASGNAPYDVNTFDGLRYDTASKTIMPNVDLPSDQQYQVEIDFLLSHTKRPVTFAFRFHVPAPTPIDFPYPQSQQYVTIKKVYKVFTGGLVGNLLAVGNLSLTEDTSTMTDDTLYQRTIYSSLGLKQYGVQPQIKTLQPFAVADQPKLTDCILTMYPG